MNRTLRWMIEVSLLAAVGCGAESTKPPATAGRPSLTIGRDTTLLVDETLSESMVAKDGRGQIIPSPSIAWQSSAPAIASVDDSGHVKALALGTATLTATMDSTVVHSTITVVRQFTSVAAGEAHACGITGRSELYCWGASFRGEVGPSAALQDCGSRFGPGTLCSPLPVRSFDVGASAVAAGEEFTCALAADGRASCWGSNYYGEGGAGSSANTLQPTPVSGGYQFIQLVAGRRHVCGLTAAHDAYCWGWDRSGNLGTGGVSPDRCQGDPCSRVPQLVTGGYQWAQLAATDRATCGVTMSNDLYCWGRDVGGNDGLYCDLPDNFFGCTHVPLRIVSSQSYKAISIGEVHRCAQALSGSLDCWGANYSGMLGNGSNNQTLTPAPVIGGASYASFVGERVGACALTTDGRAQCWGAGSDGQIGNGSAEDALAPTDVSGAHRFSALFSSGSSDFACGLDDKGHAYCWGFGDLGQLGDGAFSSRSAPVLVQLIRSTP